MAQTIVCVVVQALSVTFEDQSFVSIVIVSNKLLQHISKNKKNNRYRKRNASNLFALRLRHYYSKTSFIVPVACSTIHATPTITENEAEKSPMRSSSTCELRLRRPVISP